MSAANIWDDVTDNLGAMLADDLRNMAREYEAGAERSQQRDPGPSQIGTPCTRCLARSVLGMPLTRTFDDPWCRILGTAGHAWLDDAAAYGNAQALVNINRTARWHPERHVHPHPDLLPSGGKADLFDAETGTVIDHKIVGTEPLRKYRLNGPGEQYRRQVHLYGLGCHRAGETVNNVAIAFWKRGGRLADLYVWTEPYRADIALETLERYRTIRDLALASGAGIIPLLPAHPSCWNCSGKDVSAEELAVINRAGVAPD